MAEYEILPTRPIIPFETYVEKSFLIKNKNTEDLMVLFIVPSGGFYEDMGVTEGSWAALPLDHLYPICHIGGTIITLRNSIDDRLWGSQSDIWFPLEEYNTEDQILFDLNDSRIYYWSGIVGSIPIKTDITNPYEESGISMFNDIDCYSKYVSRLRSSFKVYKEPFSTTLEYWNDSNRALDLECELMGYYSNSSRKDEFPTGVFTGQGLFSGKSFSISKTEKKSKKYLSNAAMFKWETTYELL